MTNALGTSRWSRDGLQAAGFVGWHRFGDLCDRLGSIPRTAGGVYVVYRDTDAEPTFLAKSPAGTWRREPTVPVDLLTETWVSGTRLLNVGKANHGQLRNRLRTSHSFGMGRKRPHEGGRYVWQLADAWNCLVAWKVLPLDDAPRDVEEAMIADFRTEFGKRPFANLVG